MRTLLPRCLASLLLLWLMLAPTWADEFSGQVTGLSPLSLLGEDGKTTQSFSLKSGVSIPDWVKVGSKVTVDYSILSVMGAGSNGQRQCFQAKLAERVRKFRTKSQHLPSGVDPFKQSR